MQLVYLDNNVWNLLIDDAHAPLNQALLIDGYRRGHIQVVGSLAVLEEILGIAVRLPAKYKAVDRAYRRLTGPRTLLPLNERHAAEVSAGGRLSETERYCRSARLRAVRAHLGRHDHLIDTADAVYSAKEADYERQVRSRDDVKLALSNRSLKPSRDLNAWFEESDVVEWVRDLLVEGVARGLITWNDRDSITAERFPSAWLHVMYSMVRIKRAIADNRRIQPSDRHDVEHVAAGAYFDTLVTLDKEMVASLSELPSLPFEVVDADTFALRLQSMRTVASNS